MWMRFGTTQTARRSRAGCAGARALARSAVQSARVGGHRSLAQTSRSRQRRERDDRGNDVGRIQATRRAARAARRDRRRARRAAVCAAIRRTHRVAQERSGPYRIGDVEIRTSIKHVHAVETYGMHFRYAGRTVSYLPCGRLFDGLARDYASHKPDVLVINVLRYRDSMDVDHMTFDQAKAVMARSSAARRGHAALRHEDARTEPRAPGARGRGRPGDPRDCRVRQYAPRRRNRGRGACRLRSCASSPAPSMEFVRGAEREALKTFYDFSVIWHEQIARLCGDGRRANRRGRADSRCRVAGGRASASSCCRNARGGRHRAGATAERRRRRELLQLPQDDGARSAPAAARRNFSSAAATAKRPCSRSTRSN